MRDTANIRLVDAKARARRRVSKHPVRRAVDQRVQSGLDAALEAVRAEIADDSRRETNEAGGSGSPDDVAGLSEAQVRFLAALRLRPSVGCAMRTGHVRFANLRVWRESARFRELESEATEIGKGVLFETAWNAAVVGSLVAVYQGGRCVGFKRVFCSRMREMLARALMPDLFDRGALAGKPARPTIVLGTPEQIAEVVRRYSPTARRMEPGAASEGSTVAV